jgi:hypothetical protein
LSIPRPSGAIKIARVPERYLLFVWKPTGYELRERDGEPPKVGDEVEEDGVQMTVTKVAASPLPGDARRCAYLQPTA